MKTLLALFLCGFLFHGCSVYEAVHAPPSMDYKHVRFGETRSETIAHLGIPKLTEKNGDEQVDYFEFLDGYNPASKARILFYIAGDVFTLCLAEVIWWPMEMAIFDGKLCLATVKYGPDGLVKSYKVLDKKNNPLWVGPAPVTPALIRSPAEPEIKQVPPDTPAKPLGTRPRE